MALPPAEREAAFIFALEQLTGDAALAPLIDRHGLTRSEAVAVNLIQRNAGRTVTVEQITQAVAWVTGSDEASPGSVPVYVRRARLKGVQIQTVHGLGYRAG